MAKGDEELEGGESEEKKVSTDGSVKMKQILIVISVALISMIISALITFLAVRPAKDESAMSFAPDAALQGDQELLPEGADDEDLIDEDYQPVGAMVPLEAILVNLAQGGYLRAQMQIEFEDRHVPPRFYNQLVPIRDGIIMILTQRTAAELRTVNGKDALRNDVRDLINGLLKRLLVKRIYFTQFVVQDAGGGERE